ncbi:serine integrase family protein [Streptomyces dysideae]|uniref:Resolvase/invertase-type recombinase catalytic domain-containing protein n=1 Tax=Streptomyces dysideae TaxID=909626 RepID=A0A101V119_9ACTN|nr:recombinase family protein [Streptomyces dysideae]KUO20565.1 hypothetical protein AQJ91_13455 [Streptomyces dysideae]
MIDTRNPARPSKTFSRSYVAPELQAHLDQGGTFEEWLAGRTPIASMARISADRLSGDAIGVARQHKNNARNAALHNCTVVVCYEDNNLTAAKREVVRPAFLQMIKDLTHGHEEETGIPVKGCIAVERERVYRLPEDFIALQDALSMNGSGIFIEGRALLSPVEGDAPIIAGPGWPGSVESEVGTIRKRTRRSAKDRAEEGGVPGSPRRFGWLGAEKRHGRLNNEQQNAAEWPYLVQMVKMRAEGRSWGSVTRWIATQKDGEGNPIRTVRGGRWSDQGVKAIITNPAWWGGRILNGDLVRDAGTGEPKLGEWEHADPATDGVGYETWKLIMSGVQSTALHRGMKQAPAAKAAGREVFRTGKYKFSGTLRCGRINEAGEICHSRLVGNAASGRNAKYGDYYRCNDPNCKGVGRQVASVDAYLEELVLSYLDEHYADTEPSTTPWRGMEKLAGLRVQHKKIQDSVADGEVDWDDVHDMLTRLNRNIRTLEAEEQEHLAAEAKRNLLRGWRRESWEGKDLAEKKEVISHVLAAVIVLPIPEGGSDKAPFDPTLLKVNWRQPSHGRVVIAAPAPPHPHPQP